ncbi:MAG TPA: hypothetical protein VGM81_20160 [Burkholderiaceae bacterium]|jgi:hypothetical protein
MKLTPVSWFLSSTLVLSLVGCASSKTGNDSLGTIGAVSAIGTAGALAPAAAVYHAVSGDLRELDAKRQQLKGMLDPMYEERIRELRARDPEADAESAYNEGHVAYIPTVPGFYIRPGVKECLPRNGCSEADIQANTEVIRNSALLSQLEMLVAQIPQEESMEKEIGVIYISEVFTRFRAECSRYMKAFNIRMMALATGQLGPSPSAQRTISGAVEVRR